MPAPTQQAAVLNVLPKHYGISYDARKSPQNGGLAYAYAPGGALTQGSLTSVFGTFTCNNASYYMGSAGLLVQAVTNTPRIEYDILGNLRGLLLEQSQTNQLLWSRDQTNVAWVKTTMTAAKDQTGVDGTANGASSLLATAGNALSLQTIVQAAAASTFSFWVKRLTGTGTVGICQDGVTFTTIVLTSAWQRFTLTATQLNPVLGFRIVTDTDKIAVDFGQFEAGNFATSVIPTTSSAIFRAVDVCARTVGAEYSVTVGTATLYGDFVSALPPATCFSFDFDDGTLNNRVGVQRLAADGTVRSNITTGGANQALCTAGIVATAGLKFKCGIVWAANDFAATLNGAAPGTDAAGTIPTITTLSLGSANSGTVNPECMHVLAFDYYPARITDANLRAMTTL